LTALLAAGVLTQRCRSGMDRRRPSAFL